MAQIPDVPVIDPVELPRESPQQAGRPGEDVQGLAETSTDIAVTGLQLQAHIREAQKQVDTVAARNQLDNVITNMHDQLLKTTNSREIDGIKTQTQEELNQVAAQWSKSPASVQIQMNADGLLPSVDHFSTVRQVDLQTKEWDANTTLQIQKVLPEAVQARRSGDTQQEQFINGYVTSLYDGAVKTGIITEADKQLALNAYQIAFQKQVNEASITSADPKERQQAIAQLKNGGNGPLDLTNLAPGDLSALREHALETNERLNNLSESQNLNTHLNTINNAFQAPEFKDNFEAQEKALQDGDWLVQHGIVADDGSPDRVMADKLEQQVSVQRAYREKEQQDKAEDFSNKVSPLIDDNKISLAQLNHEVDISGLTGKALNSTRAALVRQWTANARTNHEFALWDRQAAEQEKRTRSSDSMAQYMMDIMAGKMPDIVTIKTDPNMVQADKFQVSAALLASQKNDPNFVSAMAVLDDVFPRAPRAGTPSQPATPEQIAQSNIEDQQNLRLRAETYTQWMQRINANPSENKMDALKDVAHSTTQRDIANRLNQIFNPAPDKPSWWTKLGDAMSPGRTADKTAQPASTDNSAHPPTTAPNIGDIKKFPNGKTGRWDGTGWVAQ